MNGKCLFCDSDLDEDTKPEHILQSALGGRKTSQRLICSAHNELFGATMDRAVAEQVRFIRNFAQFPSGTGQPPPSLQNVLSGDDKLTVRSDGSLQLTGKPLHITKDADGHQSLQIRAGSAEQLASLLPHIAALLKMSEAEALEALKANRIVITTRPPDGVAHTTVQFGGEDVARSLTKSCLELWATRVGNDEVRSPSYAAARAFVLGENPDFQHDSRDTRRVPAEVDLVDKYGEFFNLIYVRSDAAGRVIAHFTLYNMTGWRIVLAEHGGTPDLQVGLVSNPADPKDWSDKIADMIEIDFGWLDTIVPPDDTFERTREQFGALYKRHHELARAREIGFIVDGAFERHGRTEISLETEQALFRRITHEISDRATRHILRLPHEQVLSPDEIERLLRPPANPDRPPE